MKLHEIIEVIDARDGQVISTETLHPYRRSLLTYYKNLFYDEPMLLVESVFNAVQYATICQACEMEEAMQDLGIEDEDDKETIYFNSIPLQQFANIK